MHNPEHATAADVQRTLNTGAPRSPWRRYWRWAIAALIAAALVYWYTQRSAGEEVRYRSETAARGDLTVTVTATGTLEPTNQVDIGSELSGTIREVYADYSGSVKKGGVLAVLDTTRLNAQVLQAKSAVASAEADISQNEANLQEAQANLARLQKVRELSGNKIPSQQDLDVAAATAARAAAQLQAAKAAAAQAKATLDAAQTDLSKAQIRSPIDGVVLQRSVEPGQTVAASLQAPVLFTLAEDLKRMELHVDVDEADVGKVRVGQPATFTVDAYPDRTFHARIQEVRYSSSTTKSSTSSSGSSSSASAASTGVVTYETVLEVDNSDLLLRPRMTATAQITVQQIKDAVLIPNAALRFSPPADKNAPSGSPGASNRNGIMGALVPRMPRRGQAGRGEPKRDSRVWTLKDGKPQPLTVRIGASDGRNTQVLDGDVQPGMQLLVDAESAANAR